MRLYKFVISKYKNIEMWFEDLTGFKEENPDQVRLNLEVSGSTLMSKVNGFKYNFGRLEIPTLDELKKQSPNLGTYKSKLNIEEVVGNIQTFHKEKSNNGALFQAASQFNLLEMVGPSVTPERGVGIYEKDHTQGPACAIACGAGTIFRNYFVNVNGHIGQSSNNQIDCLRDVGIALNNEKNKLWEMSNGYALASVEGLKTISQHLKNKSDFEKLKDKLRIGLQWDTEVTIGESKHLVTQAYCSALPVAYSRVEPEYWTDFARLILEATYEATFFAALINYHNTGNNKVFLTLVGGGAFGNRMEWIIDAIRKSIKKFSNTPLDVKIVSYGSSKAIVRELLK
jgi:hypothetical protein